MASTSRYATSAHRDYTFPDGRTVTYLASRILPSGGAAPAAGTLAVREDEVHRLDLIAFRVMRNPMLAWRIADANDAMDPMAVCGRAGDRLFLPKSEL